MGDFKDRHQVVLGNKTVLRQKIQNALSQNIQKLNKVSLKHRYETEFRPKLSCYGLLLPNGLDSDSTAFLHHQHHKQNRETPQYLSAYELMIQRLRINNEDEWGHFWDQIINNRIFIVDTWDNNVGNVETLHYDYGIKGFYKGEVDASFHDGKQGKKGTARISFVLWREDKVVYAEVYEDLECSSIHVEEGYAALALFFKCIELNITELVIWTDNVDIQGCITGSYTVKQIENPTDLEEEHRNLFDLLGCMRSSFTQLRAMCKPRELMFLVDDLSTFVGGIPKLEDAIKKFNYQLNQNAIFRFSHAAYARAIIKKFGYCPFVGRHETKFFVLVENLDKLDAVAQITDALCPSGVYIAVQQLDEKPLNFQNRLQQMVGSYLRHQSSVDDDRTLLHYSIKDNGMELLIIVDGTIPHGTYDCLGCFTVILVSAVERKQLDPAINEFNALSYRYFMGVVV